MRTTSVLEAIDVFKVVTGIKDFSVIDVGVQYKTEFLMSAFPHAHHYLFEPVILYHGYIESNYRAADINFSLDGSAVSSEAGVMWQYLFSHDNSGSVTHSQLLSSPDASHFGASLLDVFQTNVITLDDWMFGKSLEEHYVIKIDVDGIEDKIIEGGKSLLSGAAMVIVESTLEKLALRAVSLQSLGLKLFDIVGNGYYCDQLQQVDLIFISEKLATTCLNLQPWKKTGRIVWEYWQQD